MGKMDPTEVLLATFFLLQEIQSACANAIGQINRVVDAHRLPSALDAHQPAEEEEPYP